MARNSTLALEPLELRENPHVSVWAISGTLSITSDGEGDVVQVVTEGAGVRAQKWSGTQWDNVSTLLVGLSKIVFAGNDGNDTFSNATNVKLEADGGYGNDTISGGTNDDVIRGGLGDDTLYGGAGNDYLTDAVVVPGPFPGTVTVLEGGNDKMYGGTGRDTIYAGSGDDYLDGGKDGALDTLWGQGGKDTFVIEPSGLDWPKDYNPAEDMII